MWYPFGPNRAFTEEWWNELAEADDQSRYIEVRADGVEVARVELDESVSFDFYIGAPTLGRMALEVQFIEVAADHRRRRIGLSVVNALAERHPDRRLVAFSEGADRFWASLGWTRYEHSDGCSRPLFIQPR
ncbi:hypothetical protein B8281_15905 [Cellulosimicrobium sp. TH-20]|nr:hypothetical protein B8281_15905 [Cellulosimicrobium sp. TH-20]